jgi:transketolase
MNTLHEKIIELSKKHKLSHLGSNLTAVNIIAEIYGKKRENEPFILSCGHCGLALYVVLEKYYGIDAEKLFLKHGIHPDRDEENKIYCSTGSLGMGIGIATGMALADRTKNVYCLISDGEAFEGSVYEAANVIRKYDIKNLKVYLNFNRLSAYDTIEGWMLSNILRIFPVIEVRQTSVEDYGLNGLSAHYINI